MQAAFKAFERKDIKYRWGGGLARLVVTGCVHTHCCTVTTTVLRSLLPDLLLAFAAGRT